MEEVLDSPEIHSQPIVYIGFWRRFAAAFIDGVVISIVNGGLAMLFNNSPLSSMGSFFIGWIYSALMESSEKQATVGKMVLGIKVGNLDGHRINFMTATGRHFGKLLSLLILGFGFIMIAFSPKKQGLHDKLADTIVFKGEA